MILLYLALVCDLAGIALMGVLLVKEYRPRFVETAGHTRPISLAGYSGHPSMGEGLLRLAQAVYAFTDKILDCPCQQAGRCPCGR
ncbi:hypothetical protein GCM10022254_76240 [Actinomadura meridiana]|uniref:Uncharacterized protein n=1 Tax=Actinomadura meridiana TaxID=559626 RepID=A0ABP8CSY0_9ACTN